ncbi:MAG: hypothetical protein ACRD8O_03640 [Bryobacteraceae bacterium]
MPDERRQFRVLYRDFLFRMIDLELLSERGEIQKLLGQFVAMLAALSFTFVLAGAPALAKLPLDRRMMAGWATQEFLISTTMAIAGLFAVLAWNVVLPDRRDTLVLAPLPVRTRTLFLARIAATCSALAIGIVAVNVFTGICFPLLFMPRGGGLLYALRSFGAYWVTMTAAGLFVFCALLSLQGVAAQVLSYGLFLRISSWLQLGAFFLILGVYFLTPPLASPRAITAPENQRLLASLPSFWFLGLFQQLSGAAHPAFAPLAERALGGLIISSLVVAVTKALVYRRTMRSVIEQPDIAPGDRSRPVSRIARYLAAKLLPNSLERAVVLFIVRTLARSRQHRLVLALYAGAGLAIALAYAKSLLYGYSRMRWDHVNVPFLIGSLVVLCFAVLGARMVFSLPVSLPANWIFRITAVHSPTAYYDAIRKALFAITAGPVWIAFAILYVTIWPSLPALQHVAVLVLVGIGLVEGSLDGFRKIPFACSYLPGKANLNTRLGIFGILFICMAEIGVQIEYWAMRGPARFVVMIGTLLGVAIWARRRRAEFASAPHTPIQFEDVPPEELLVLDLQGKTAM